MRGTHMPNNDPYLDAGLRGWIKNTARREHWRVASWYSVEDLEQDGYLCYSKCWAKYRKEVHGKPSNYFDVPNPTKTQRRWFMMLVQRAFYNHIMTLHRRAALTSEDALSQVSDPTDSVAQAFERIAPPVAEEASLFLALAKAPTELLEVLEKLVLDGCDGGAYLRRRVLNPNGKPGKQTVRETSVQYWERVTGVPDLTERLADYLNV